MRPSPPRFRDILDVLSRHGVEFVIVGGVAAVLNGAPIATFDLDIVHARGEANLDRLLAALHELDAKYRDLTGRTLRPTRENLAGDGHNLLITKLGPLDALGKIGANSTFEDLMRESRELKVGALSLHVLTLAALIRLKEQTARDKDLAVLPILRKTLEES